MLVVLHRTWRLMGGGLHLHTPCQKAKRRARHTSTGRDKKGGAGVACLGVLLHKVPGQRNSKLLRAAGRAELQEGQAD